MIKILVNGARGKMGQEAAKAIMNDPDLMLAGTANREDNLAAVIQATKAQVVLDLTTASAVYQNALTIIENNCHPVIGTSGLSTEQITLLQQQCAEKQLGGIIAPNFSISALLMMRLAQIAAPYFSDVEIIEMHHSGKKDSPSGTAIKTALMISGQNKKEHSSTEIITGARGAQVNNIPVHSVRLSGLVATQEVIFGGQGATLSIKDCAINRDAYMPGICLACKKVISLHSLVYGLEEIFDVA